MSGMIGDDLELRRDYDNIEALSWRFPVEAGYDASGHGLAFSLGIIGQAAPLIGPIDLSDVAVTLDAAGFATVVGVLRLTPPDLSALVPGRVYWYRAVMTDAAGRRLLAAEGEAYVI